MFMTAPVRSRLARWASAAFTLDARSLAVYRIGLGLLLLVDSLLRTRDFSLMFAPRGIFPLAAIAEYYGDPTNWSVAFWHDSAWWGGLVLATQGLAGIALAAGYRTRLATVIGWIALVSVVRRTAPATNAGDMWLGCQLLWSMFLPLGEWWSVDARCRAAEAGDGGEPDRPQRPVAVFSIASAALVLQLVAVYWGAGFSKCNQTWFEGQAVTHALSVHDHGTPLGMRLGQFAGVAWAAKWAVLGGEIILPLALVAATSPRVRSGIVLAFIAFHAAIWLTMSVGLFAPIGMVAWLPLIPSTWWPQPALQAARKPAGLRPAASLACGLAASLAAVSFVHQVTPWQSQALPRWLAAPLNLTALRQAWAMFALVPAQEQWIYSRAVLKDGSIVDVLRRGRPVESVRPGGGFCSLPHHRWHKFFWILPRPQTRMFADPTAAALADDWNRRVAADRQMTSLEIRFAVQPGGSGADAAVRDALVAAWPTRSPAGSGNLDRFLQANERAEATPSEAAWSAADQPPTSEQSRPGSSLTLLPPPR